MGVASTAAVLFSPDTHHIIFVIQLFFSLSIFFFSCIQMLAHICILHCAHGTSFESLSRGQATRRRKSSSTNLKVSLFQRRAKTLHAITHICHFYWFFCLHITTFTAACSRERRKSLPHCLRGKYEEPRPAISVTCVTSAKKVSQHR